MPFLHNTLKYLNVKILMLVLASTCCFIQNAKPEVPDRAAHDLKEILMFTTGMSLVGAFGLVIKERINFLKKELEHKWIEDWILKNDLNAYGESYDTVYNNGCPLAPDQTRHTYLINKFPDKPWLKEYEHLAKATIGLNMVSTFMVVLGYSSLIIPPLIGLGIVWYYDCKELDELQQLCLKIKA